MSFVENTNQSSIFEVLKIFDFITKQKDERGSFAIHDGYLKHLIRF